MRFGVAALVALALLTPAAGGAGGSDGTEELTIGVVPQRSIERGETGDMTDAGISSVRVWISWAQVEWVRGEFDWGGVDQAIAANADGGLTTLPFLFGTPPWAGNHDGCEGECVAFAPRSEETREAFARFAAAAVRRYGPHGAFWDQRRGLPYRPVETWQIWNEPNLSSFYRPAVDPIGYASLVQAAAERIRRADPHAKVVLAGLSGTDTNAKRISTSSFLTQLYSVRDIAASFDGIAVHPYDRNVRGTLDQIENARTIAAMNGDHPDLYVTELGWSSAGKRRWGLVKTPDGQARLLRLTLTSLLDNADRLDLRAVYWYAWRDTDRGHSVCGWCPWSGLLDRVGDPKPAYWALRALTQG